MARPIKKRKICSLPESTAFMPMNSCYREKERIILSIDEYECIRLIDLEGLSQEECGKNMHVARTTIQRIYQEARKKIAKALVEGRSLVIEGGDYKVCKGNGKNCKKKTCQFRNSKSF